MRGIQHEYCHYLNSDDLYDPELPLVKARAVGGTLAMWRKWLDPYVSIYPTQTSAFLPLILKIPGTRISVHMALYLPTHGKDPEFISEFASMKNCIEEISVLHNNPLLFIRGDGNCNPKNIIRYQVLKHFIQDYNLKQVKISHPTYHHFVGNGKYDSNIDIIIHTTAEGVTEKVKNIICRNDRPDISSHHDIITTVFSLPYQAPPKKQPDLIEAPRTILKRNKILWTEDGIHQYQGLVEEQLQELRNRWLCEGSKAAIAVLLQSTHDIMNLAATTTNPSVSLNEEKYCKAFKTPHSVTRAKRKLDKKHRMMLKRGTSSSILQLKSARKQYRLAVRTWRLTEAVKRDTRLDTILSKDPKQIYSYLRSARKTKNTSIQSLTVGKKLYEGTKVADGFYDSMTGLKSCDMKALQDNPSLAHHFSNYKHIMRICQAKQNIPEVSLLSAKKLLTRMKTHVTDIYGITPLHYLYAGEEGIKHYAGLLNAFISEVNNVTIDDLNRTLGLIHYKGHKKDKNSDRSYRTISTCPFIAKSIDLHLRDLYQESWDNSTASTQYQTSGSSHELASLLVTELTQYSLYVLDQPVYLLVLDAQSAYDRCLRQILCTELFMSGVSGSALLLLNSRLENRSTVYQWEGEMLGPAYDNTGFEQGGINSGDFYKLYNNEQLKSAQSSCLGVNLGSSIVSAIGQADDVILAANNVFNLKLLARLTEVYCSNFRVQLVASKTKLLPIFLPRHSLLVEQAKLANSVTVDNTIVEFVNEAEHVGVFRSSSGNMPNIVHRIACYKKAMLSVSSSGIARSHRGNPAASLRVHQLYAVPVLLSGLGSLVLNESELKIIDANYKNTVQNIQRLHQNTPRGVVFLLSGSLPGRAILHCRQLSLLLMICHLPNNPLHKHALHILSSVPVSSKSWFHQVSSLCSLYGLPVPLQLLGFPPQREQFKKLVKQKVAQYWHSKFTAEIYGLRSLKYFRPELYSLTKPHYMWVLAASNPYECAKSSILAKMVSGRYRTDMLTRYWSNNRSGYCRAPSCLATPGTLEHLLATCPALNKTRQRMYQMWLERSVMFPALHATIRAVINATEDTVTQFVLEPLSFSDILSDFISLGTSFAQSLSFLTRTFAFYMHKDYQKLIQCLNDPTQRHKMHEYYSNTSYVSALRCLTTCDKPPMPTSQACSVSAQLGQSCAAPGHTSTTLTSTTTTSQVAQENNQQAVQCEGDHLHCCSNIPVVTLSHSDTIITTPPPPTPACLTSVGTNLLVKLPTNNRVSEPGSMEGVAAGHMSSDTTTTIQLYDNQQGEEECDGEAVHGRDSVSFRQQPLPKVVNFVSPLCR